MTCLRFEDFRHSDIEHINLRKFFKQRGGVSKNKVIAGTVAAKRSGCTGALVLGHEAQTIGINYRRIDLVLEPIT